MDEKQAQQKYMEIQMQYQQLQQIEKQIQMLQQQIQEVITTKDALKNISGTEVGKEILLPITSGIFLKGELKDNTELIINVGSGVATPKSFQEADALLNTQLTELENFHKELDDNKTKLTQQIETFQAEIQEMMK